MWKESDLHLPATGMHYKMCCTFSVLVTVTAMQIPWPLLSCYCLHPTLQWPELGSSSAGARSQLHKCPGLKQRLLACIHTTCSMPLIPMSTPAMAGYSLCSRRVKSVQVVPSCSSHRPPTDTSERQDARSQPCSSLQPRAPHCSVCWWGKVGWHCCPPLFLLLLTSHYKDQWSEVLPEEQLPQPWDKKLSGWWLWQLLSLNERFWSLLEKTGSSQMDVHAHTELGSGKARPLTLPRCCSTETALEPVLPSHTQHQEKQTPSPCKASVMHQPGYHFY